MNLSFRPPGHHRSRRLRRLLAVALVVAAALSALHSATAEHPRIVIFARPVAAGAELTADDVELRPVPDELVPEAAVTDVDAVTGRVITAAAGAGEPVTELRVLSPTLINRLVGAADEAATMVPVTLADPEIAALLQHGDTVSIVTVAPEGTEPMVVAEGARVILAEDESESILVALGHGAAEDVAAASLTAPLAVVVTGPRARGPIVGVS